MSVLGDGDASPSSNNCSFMEYLSPFLLKMTDKESSETNIHTAMYPGHGNILYSENNIQGNKIYSYKILPHFRLVSITEMMTDLHKYT